MHKTLSFIAIACGLATILIAGPVANGEAGYSEFLARHDRLHPINRAERVPYKIKVRKAFWDNHDRVLRVEAETNREKGDLLILEGLPGSDWVTAFSISADFGAQFELPIPADHSVPCEIVVKSGAEFKISSVGNAPENCSTEAEGMLFAGIGPG